MARGGTKRKMTSAKDKDESFRLDDRTSQLTNVGDVVFVAVTSFAKNRMDNAVSAVAQLCNGATRPFPIVISQLNKECIPNIDPNIRSYLDCALNEDGKSKPVFPVRNCIRVFDAHTGLDMNILGPCIDACMGIPSPQRFMVGSNHGGDSALNQMWLMDDYDLKRDHDELFVSIYREIDDNDVKAIIVSQNMNYQNGVHQYTLVCIKGHWFIIDGKCTFRWNIELDVHPPIPVGDSTLCVMDYLLSPGAHLQTIFDESSGDVV